MTNTLNNSLDESQSELTAQLSAEELAAKPEQLTLAEWRFHIEKNNTGHQLILETLAKLAIRFKNTDKYYDSGVYREEVDRSYLHHDSYEVRKAKAEQLNGCKFKPARAYKPYKWQNWNGPVSTYSSDRNYLGLGHCDGKMTRLAANVSFWAMITLLQIVLFITAMVYLFGAQWLVGMSCGVLSILGCHKLRKKLRPLDFFLFNRHTGLVRTPHCLFRRSFYIPYEDLACYDGETIQGARSGGRMGTTKIRVTQIPKRFYLFTPSFILMLGGIPKGHWANIHHFMDTSISLESSINESIERCYIADENIARDGPFPEEMKAYLDPDDKQVNRWHVW
jgi:hypothetical protein